MIDSHAELIYITEGDELIILFAGSDKSDQQATINSAKEYLIDYKARKPVKAPDQIVVAKNTRKKRKRKNK